MRRHGEGLGRPPFFLQLLSEFARHKIVSLLKSRGVLIQEVSDVLRKCIDGSICSSHFLVLIRFSKTYLD